MVTARVPAALVSRNRWIVSLSMAGVAGLSWFVLIAGHTLWHPGGGLAAPSALATAFAMWMTMMVAMMLPPVMPWILLYSSASAARGSSLGPTALFVGGYLAVWAAFSGVAAAVQLVLQRGGWVTGHDPKSGPIVGGALLIGAGVFQLTPLKSACLAHCRSPLSFFLERWQDGPAGALRMGVRHGLFCLACCWALMSLSFALGVMNLLWMAVLTLMLCVEKIAPGGQAFSRLFGGALAVWGVWLIAT
jgi:predicted metal-binding membrane protein